MINFCYDKLAAPNIGYPNLATWPAVPYTTEWSQFDAHWPRTVPLRLTMYLDAAHIEYSVYTVEDAPAGSWYPIAFSWFDFTCDYFSMLSIELKQRLTKGEIKILFYYHEGDNPKRIVEHLLYSQYDMRLPKNCYHFVSANTAADSINFSTYFSEHEFFFRHVNRKQRPLAVPGQRMYDFTALNRTHKWWRASIMTDLLHHCVLDNSQWSYHSDCTIDEEYNDNPIELDQDNTWRERMHKFVSDGPYMCDELNLQKQNDHRYVNPDLYSNSYFQIIIETHFDADQSNGTFITEKTWKPIKYGQPFVVVGPAGTLAALRSAGYRVFDSVLNNTYDTIKNNTERWVAIRNLLVEMKQTGVAELAELCQTDVEHNQQVFENRTAEPLNILLEKLQCQN
jgi:hypothetical protein